MWINTVNGKTKRVLFSTAALACCSVAWSGAPQPFSDVLFLDWDGFRSALREEGIDIRVGYVSETATNPQGGEREGWAYTDQWTFMGTLDLDKLLSLNDAQFRITITDRNGHSLSAAQNLDNLQQVQELYGRGQTWRFTQFWYEQSYFSGKVDWKIGRLTDGEDFASFSCEFMNLTFCGAPPGNIVGSYWYNWPVSQWATRVKVSLSRTVYAQVGAFEVNPSYLQTRYALGLGDPPGATGVLAPIEIGWLPKFGRGLDGSYKFGAWYDSSRAADVVKGTNGQPWAIDGGQPLMHNGQYGAYINFLQRVTSAPDTSKRGLSVFLNATFADRQTSTIDNQVAAGLLYRGPFVQRPADELGFAVGATHVNTRVAALERLQNAAGLGPVAVQSSEYASELYYAFDPAPWLDLRPNVQYVYQPGGTAQNRADLIVGLRVSVNF